VFYSACLNRVFSFDPRKPTCSILPFTLQRSYSICLNPSAAFDPSKSGRDNRAASTKTLSSSLSIGTSRFDSCYLTVPFEPASIHRSQFFPRFIFRGKQKCTAACSSLMNACQKSCSGIRPFARNRSKFMGSSLSRNALYCVVDLLSAFVRPSILNPASTYPN
jgi:hypothetical protein